MADLNDLTQNVNIWDDAKQKSVTVTTDGSHERLDVDARITEAQSEITIQVRPGLYVAEFLVNGASPYMNVDGSVTPVSFQKSPPSGKKWYIKTLSIQLEDSSINFSKFGGRSSLTNGVDLYVKEGGESERLLGNFKRNGDVYIFARDVQLESASTDILTVYADIYESSFTTWSLTDSLTEYVKLTVNDDLTAIQQFLILIRGYEVDE